MANIYVIVKVNQYSWSFFFTFTLYIFSRLLLNSKQQHKLTNRKCQCSKAQHKSSKVKSVVLTLLLVI